MLDLKSAFDRSSDCLHDSLRRKYPVRKELNVARNMQIIRLIRRLPVGLGSML
jgi:hypothetical protein